MLMHGHVHFRRISVSTICTENKIDQTVEVQLSLSRGSVPIKSAQNAWKTLHASISIFEDKSIIGPYANLTETEGNAVFLRSYGGRPKFENRKISQSNKQTINSRPSNLFKIRLQNKKQRPKSLLTARCSCGGPNQESFSHKWRPQVALIVIYILLSIHLMIQFSHMSSNISQGSESVLIILNQIKANIIFVRSFSLINWKKELS